MGEELVAVERAITYEKGLRIRDILDRTFKYWALVPAVILLLLLTIVPMVELLRMAVSKVEFVAGGALWRFVGLRNVETLLGDWLLPIVLRNTSVFVVGVVSIEMGLGFTLAMVTSRLRRGIGVYRTIMTIPILMPAIAIGCMWRLLYDSDFGLISRSLVIFGGTPVPFLSDARYAMASVILVDVWHWTSFVFLICLAGFESLPTEVIEAASVDGASGWQLLRFIVLPLMWPTVSVALMFRTLFSLKVFDEIFLLTSGGPGTSTEVLSLFIYKTFFRQSRFGYGAVVSLSMILVVTFALLVFRRLGAKEEG